MSRVYLQQLVAMARQDAVARGFRHTGIYNLLWVAWKNQPEEFSKLLANYRVNQPLFLKMLETILRPRRAGGGVPRDRQDADLLELALVASDQLARQHDQQPSIEHLFASFSHLEEDPIVTLCERFSVDYHRPAG